jgi:hypothetical protein
MDILPHPSPPLFTIDNAETWISSEAYRLFMHHTFKFEALDCDAIPSGVIKAYRQLVSSFILF